MSWGEEGFGKCDNPLLVWSLILHVYLELEDGWLGANVGAVGAGSVLDEVVEAMDVAGTAGLLLPLDEVIEFSNGTLRCPLKELIMVNVVDIMTIPCKVMMVSTLL